MGSTIWINNSKGLSYFIVTDEVNEKRQEMITEKITRKKAKLCQLTHKNKTLTIELYSLSNPGDNRKFISKILC